jgi:ABC-2 type transport system ATP-binding protein
MIPALQVRNLTRSFGSIPAVKDVSFTIAQGECCGLLGPNGAGKTTTLSLITGLLALDRGEVLIHGAKLEGDRDPAKRRLGVVPQDLALYEELSALDNLKLFGSLYGLASSALAKPIREALELVGLQERSRDKVKAFSGGMKRRLNIAAALLHNPDLLFLDEPTVGVDPQSRNAIFDNITTLRQSGKTVLYTTHYLEEVERLCDHVLIMDHGRLIADDSLAVLKKRVARTGLLRLELGSAASRHWLEELQRISGVRSAGLNGDKLEVTVENLSTGASEVLGFLQRHGETVVQIESDRPSLETVFLQLTGGALRD